jgi:AraC-like DNA-binding protein
MERAAALLRDTDHTVARICAEVGLASVGSFTTSFHRTFGLTPTAYRAQHPPAARRAPVPSCVLMAWARPRGRAVSEKTPAVAGVSVVTDR